MAIFRVPKEIRTNEELTPEEFYNTFGIILKNPDGITFEAEFPDGWKAEQNGPYWIYYIDPKGRDRFHVFFKETIYETIGFCNPRCRYMRSIEKMEQKYYCVVKDMAKNGDIIFIPKNSYKDDMSILDYNFAKQATMVETGFWLRDHYPDYENWRAYWDD